MLRAVLGVAVGQSPASAGTFAREQGGSVRP
jgi:hypothetical protein